MSEILQVELGNELVLVLDANPTTGYSWEASFDEEHIALLKQEYRQTSDLVGGGGKVVFTFRPVKQGRGSISLRYRRPWEPEAIRTLDYDVTIP